MTMAAVATTAIKRYTNTVEYYGAVLDTLDDWFEVPCHASEYTFAVFSDGAANIKVALECGCADNPNWFTIDTSKTINAEGAYNYTYSGRPASRIRVRLSEISSGEPSVMPMIAVCYNG
jgi:hypothetical protein